MAGRGRRGPAPKGNRTHTTFRLHHVPTYRAAAEAAGFPDLNAYVDALLASAHGLAVPGGSAPGAQLALAEDDEEGAA